MDELVPWQNAVAEQEPIFYRNLKWYVMGYVMGQRAQSGIPSVALLTEVPHGEIRNLAVQHFWLKSRTARFGTSPCRTSD